MMERFIALGHIVSGTIWRLAVLCCIVALLLGRLPRRTWRLLSSWMCLVSLASHCICSILTMPRCAGTYVSQRRHAHRRCESSHPSPHRHVGRLSRATKLGSSTCGGCRTASLQSPRAGVRNMFSCAIVHRWVSAHCGNGNLIEVVSMSPMHSLSSLRH